MKGRLTMIGILLIGIAIGVGGSNLFTSQTATVGQALPKLRAGSTEEVSANTKRYSSELYRFSLEYPSSLQVQEYDEGGESMTIVFQEPGRTTQGFQIFVTPYSGTGITEERLRDDIKSGIIKEPTEVTIGDGKRALVFWSEAPIIGESREIWWIHEGHLFEVTTYADLDAWMSEILSTIQFE